MIHRVNHLSPILGAYDVKNLKYFESILHVSGIPT
jgi:hypothetical protein